MAQKIMFSSEKATSTLFNCVAWEIIKSVERHEPGKIPCGISKATPKGDEKIPEIRTWDCLLVQQQQNLLI
jgi:hypothetical protein